MSMRQSRSRGVGSLIGATFILLILLTGYSLFLMNNKEQTAYQNILSEMHQRDLEQTQEVIEFRRVTMNESGNLQLILRNNGPGTAHVVYIGIFNRSAATETQTYYNVSLFINPSETITYTSPSITFPEDGAYVIQLVTEMGNTFSANFRPGIEVSTDTIISIKAGGIWIFDQNPSDYYVETGNHVAGTVPESVQEVDGNNFVVESTSPSTRYPEAYNLLGSTGYVSGSVSNLTVDDGVKMVFASYLSKNPNIEDAVDTDSSNEDMSPDKGNSSNFTAQRFGPDGIFNELSEENTGFLRSENRYMTSSLQTVNGLTAYSLNTTQTGTYVERSSSRSGGKTCTWGIRVWKRASNGVETEITNGNKVATVIRSTNSEGTQFNTWGCPQTSLLPTDCIVVRIYVDLTANDVLLQEFVTEQLGAFQIDSGPWTIYYWTRRSFGGGQTTAYFRFADITHNSRIENFNYHLPNYQLDLEFQWTNVNYGEDNEFLCVFGGTMGSEDINVDVWQNNTWNRLITHLSTGWNNVSVSSYLTDSTFTIRFNDETGTLDTVQDQWQIDVTLLHIWTYRSRVEVEFSGSSNPYNWTGLSWTVDSAWDMEDISVTLQLYNFKEGKYPTTGDGYIAYVSSSTPNTDESKTQNMTSGPKDFRDAVGGWRLRITGEKNTQFPLQLHIDLSSFIIQSGASVAYTFTGIVTDSPQDIRFKLVSDHNVSNVGVVVQLWNYSISGYAVGGSGYDSYISKGANETKWLNITSGAADFVEGGEALLRITSTYSYYFNQRTNSLKLDYSATASGLPFNTYRAYTITVSNDVTGAPCPCASLVIFSDGSTVVFEGLSNPAYVNADESGVFKFSLKSSTVGGETFKLYVLVGSVVAEKNIVQLP